MTESNYAYNIIMKLANLPNFLQKSILQQRLNEFFTMTGNEQSEIIDNALQIGPSIPFDKFAGLLKTWLISLTNMSYTNRKIIFSQYIHKIITSPQKLVEFNLDGILEVFMILNETNKQIIIETIRDIIHELEPDKRKKLLVLIPDNMKSYLSV